MNGVHETRDGLWEQLMDSPPRLLTVDIETKSLKDRSIIGIGFGLSTTEAVYVARTSEEFANAMLLLCNPAITTIYHNAMFDLPILFNTCPFIVTTNVLDTMLMCLMEGLPVDLKGIADVLGMEIDNVSDVLPEKWTMDMLRVDEVAAKCMNDCMATMLVYETIYPHIDQKYFAREMRLIPVLMAMSRRGIRLDQERRQLLEGKLAAEVEFYRELAEAEGFNPASNQQVAYILMQRGNRIKVSRKYGAKKHTACVDEEVLKKLDDPMVALVLNFRKANKLLSTYILPYKGQERAYTRFHLSAATGRPSSTERNMQNIPPGPGTSEAPGVRTMLLPDEDKWTDLDYSQQELRTLAYVSQDEDMLYIYEHGLDIHQETADFMGCTRKVAKNVNFATIYGADDDTINETAGINNIKKAHEIGVMWRTKFRKASEWMEYTQMFGLAEGYVKTIGGRKLWLPKESEEGEAGRKRKAVNYPIQGSAAEIVKDALIICDRAGYDIALQVHDEIVIDGEVDAEALRALGLEDLGPFTCPIGVSYYERWQ